MNIRQVWMTSSLVIRASDYQCTSCTVLGSIPASVGTVESEGRQMKQCCIQYEKKTFAKAPLHSIITEQLSGSAEAGLDLGPALRRADVLYQLSHAAPSKAIWC